MIRIIDSRNTRALAALVDRAPARDAAIERRVARIGADVRRGGDRALLRYARRFDGLEGPVEIPRAELEAAAKTIPADVRRAVRAAARNIRHVARHLAPRDVADVACGARCLADGPLPPLPA